MRTAFITGASSDIGLAVCRRYLSAGWKLIAHYRTERPELIQLAGAMCELWQADFLNTAQLENDLRNDAYNLKRADAFINLAAAVRPCSLSSASADEIAQALSINLIPGLLLMRTIGPAMAVRGFGRIVHASSIGVKYGGALDSFPYSLSKHAQEFIPQACRQWAEQNVLTNVLRIGVTNTRAHRQLPGKDLRARVELIPAKRAATTTEISEALFWFGSEFNAFATGQVVAIAGGE